MLRSPLMIVLTWCIISNSGYTFDKSGCDNMLPKFDAKGTAAGEELNENKSDHSDQDGISNSEDLSPAFDKSPHKLVVSAIKYRRNRPMTVRIEGGDFDGFLLQARGFRNGASLGASIIGTFFDLPPGVGTLDCSIGPSYSVANTAYSKNATRKKDLQLKWKASKDDGSIEFVATIISGQHYWTYVKSQPLLFNEFPPSLEECGKDRSCYRYSNVGQSCEEDSFCDYIVVSQVVREDVIFTIGGKVNSGTGYVGVGFTDDEMSYIDMNICIKTSSQKAEAAHYIVQKRNRKPEKQNVQMEDAEADVDSSNIWCRFRRPLRVQIPNSKAADLTQSLSLLFLWGELDANTQNPVLPKEDKMGSVMEKWNHTQTMNVIHYVGGASVLKSNWTILIALLLATCIQLCLI